MTYTHKKKNKRPCVEVIVPIYNSAMFIEDAVRSIQQQSYENIRIIMANDGSTDSSWQKIQALAHQYDNIVPLNLAHRGVSSTLNSALAASSADWLAFLDCDDLWTSEKIERQINTLQQNSKLSLCFTHVREFDCDSNTTSFRARKEILTAPSRSSMVCDSGLFKTFGLFNESTKIGEFIEWYSRCRSSNVEKTTVPEPFTLRRVHANNTTSRVTAKDYLAAIHLTLKNQRFEKNEK
jgi:glycosyltransferase involved in cell wall biosynthesis